MAGAQEKLDKVLAQQHQIAVAIERIEAGGAAVAQAEKNMRGFVQEADELRMTLRLNYKELNEVIKSDTQRRGWWQTFIDRFGTASFAVMLWALVQYVLTRFL